MDHITYGALMVLPFYFFYTLYQKFWSETIICNNIYFRTFNNSCMVTINSEKSRKKKEGNTRYTFFM